ncbi:MAG TPA: FecR family protein [Steroidobacteraceae bacterium]|nr:FecR family protein [Steroidobacteraceae bacterium]
MNTENPTTPEEPTPETQVVEGLIRVAGRRAAPPEESYRRTLELATNAWRIKTAGVRRRRRAIVSLSTLAAAVVLLVALLPLLMRPADPPAVPVATLQRIIGQLEVLTPGSSAWRLVRDDDATLLAATRVRTGPGSRAGLTLSGGASLRLAEGTEVALDRANRLTLVAGRAYVDSGRAARGGDPIEIVTRTATAREVGTQFEVALLVETYRLRVREGLVVLSYDERQANGSAGEQLSIKPGRPLERTSILRTDAAWQWVESVAPTPDLNDRPVSELLDWVARETGRAIRYADREVERRAATTILHGSIQHLAPLEALDVMLATTQLEYVAQPDGTLLIQAKPTD